jgi:hypothetical protein
MQKPIEGRSRIGWTTTQNKLKVVSINAALGNWPFVEQNIPAQQKRRFWKHV